MWKHWYKNIRTWRRLERVKQERNIASADFVKERAELEEQIKDVMDIVGKTVNTEYGGISYRKAHIRESISMSDLRPVFKINLELFKTLKPFIKQTNINSNVTIKLI